MTFNWRTARMRIACTDYQVHHGRRILWGGAANDIIGIHERLCRPIVAGTEVVTRESFSGRPVDADVAEMQRQLDRSLESWLAAVKARRQNPPSVASW